MKLLQLAQDTYKSPMGYQIKGRGSVQPTGSPWQVSFSVVIAAEPSPLGNPQVPAVPSALAGEDMQFVNVLGGSNKRPSISDKLPPIEFSFAVVGLWDRIAENVESVTETGTETLPLNGVASACRVLQVQYKSQPDDPKPAQVTYSICSDRHLVLKKVMIYATGDHGTGALAPWTITFDTAKFNLPAPQWLLDLKSLPAVTIRKEWIGQLAPEFRLSDLSGNSIALTFMRGKVVLLDFWSISCAPCIREMPMIESISDTHKADLVAWGISFDQPDRDKKWLLQHQRTLPTLSDTDFVVSDLYKVHGIPALVLIGKDGKVKNYWEGEVPQPELEVAIQQASQN
jgi:peroxiredoxin